MEELSYRFDLSCNWKISVGDLADHIQESDEKIYSDDNQVKMQHVVLQVQFAYDGNNKCKIL